MIIFYPYSRFSGSPCSGKGTTDEMNYFFGEHFKRWLVYLKEKYTK
jgi:hypothetical protein